jgi:hypothetical protein
MEQGEVRKWTDVPLQTECFKVDFLVIPTLPQFCPNSSQFIQNSLFGINWGRVGAELGHKLVSKILTLKHPNFFEENQLGIELAICANTVLLLLL